MKGTSVLALAALCAGAHATIYDLNSDWSDASNPNGVWSYRQGTTLLPHVNSWQNTLGGWAVAQPGWADSQDGNDRLPFIFKSNGSETFVHDFLQGDVVMHTWDGANGVGNQQGNILFSTPGAGTATITGGVWMGRDIGRSVDWKIYLNGQVLTQGSLSSGDAFNRANPFNLATGSGGAGAITNINLASGDELMLQLPTTSASGDFVGMNFSVNYSPVPEPASIAALGLGGLALLRRRRKA